MGAHIGEGEASPVDRRGVLRLMRRLTASTQHYVDRAASKRGLHRSDLQALDILATARETDGVSLTPGALARALSMSPSATTTLVDRLQRAGHVVRRHDEADRRRTELSMTPLAGAEARAIFGPLALSMIAAMKELDEAEVAVVQRFLLLACEVVETQEA